jgi:two-component system response regulator
MPDAAVEILLVEDNPDDVELALSALRKARLANQIHVALDGAAALEFLFGSGESGDQALAITPRIILLDLKLPKVDGLEVLQRIKRDPRTRHIPVIVMTSSREERDVFESYELGVNSYIVKPVDFIQFREVVKQLGLYWLVINHPPAR